MTAPVCTGLTMMYPDFDGEDPFTPVLIIPGLSSPSSQIQNLQTRDPRGCPPLVVAELKMKGRLPRFQGDTWTAGGWCRLIMDVRKLVNPPHTDLFVHGEVAIGTFAGSMPFAVVYPTTWEAQMSEWFALYCDWSGVANYITAELAKRYTGATDWRVYICFVSDALALWGELGPGGHFQIQDMGFGSSAHIAQKDHLFPLEPGGNRPVYMSASISWATPEVLPSFLFRLYHEAVVKTTVTPKHLTTYPKKSILKVTATPYPYHKLTRFVIRSVINMPSFTTEAETAGWVVRDPEGTVTITVPITDEYSTNEFILGQDIFTVTERLSDWSIGEILGNTYVVAESTYIGTKPLPAGSPISIQCATNECCAPTWAIEETDAPASWNLAIDSDGLITGYIPRNEELGTYYITVSVTGPTQTTQATVYVEVTAPLIYGNVWVGKAKLDANITGLVEVGTKVFACTFEGGIFYADTADLTSWTEATYTGTPQNFSAIAKLTSTLLVAIEKQLTGTGSGKAYCWKSTDAGLNWVKIATQLSFGNSGNSYGGQMWPIDSSTFLWAASYRGTATETSIIAGQIFDPTTEAIVDTVMLPDSGIGNYPGNVETEFFYQNGVYVYCIHRANMAHLFSCSGINALGFPAATLNYLGNYGTLNNANPITAREGEFTFAPNTYGGSVIQVSTDGVTWTPTTITLADTYRLHVLSPRTPGVVQLRVAYSVASLYRTTDRWASGGGTEVLTSLGAQTGTQYPMIEIELTGVLVLGCGNATTNIFTSEE